MRILHVVNYAWPHFDGYVARTLGMVTAQRQHLGHETSLAISPFPTFSRVRDEKMRTPDWGPDHQVKVAYFSSNGSAVEQKPWERPRIGLSQQTDRMFATELRKLVQRLKPDIIHAHHPHYVGKTARKVANDMKIPFVYEVRCFNGDYDLEGSGVYGKIVGRWQNFLECRLASTADAVVTISDGLRKRLLQSGIAPDRVSVVRNSVNTDYFQPPEHPRSDGERLEVGYATTFEKIENLDSAVEAALIADEKLRTQGRRLRLTLAGTGRDWDRINDLVQKKSASDVVSLPGFLPYSGMPAFYHGLDLFLVPRKATPVARQTTPLKPLEALACGLPLLCTPLPAMQELLTGRKDVRFVESDPAGLAQGIVDYANNPWQGEGGLEARSWAGEIKTLSEVYARAREASLSVQTSASS